MFRLVGNIVQKILKCLTTFHLSMRTTDGFFILQNFWPLFKFFQILGFFSCKKFTNEAGVIQLRPMKIWMSIICLSTWFHFCQFYHLPNHFYSIQIKWGLNELDCSWNILKTIKTLACKYQNRIVSGFLLIHWRWIIKSSNIAC